MEASKNSCANVKFFVYICFFVLGLTLLWFPYEHVGYKHECFGVFLESEIHSWCDVKRILTGNAAQWCESEDEFTKIERFETQKRSALRYRPLSFFLMGLEKLVLSHIISTEVTPYHFYFFNIIFHCLNAALLFTILSWFAPLTYAIAGGLFFLFHGSFSKWLGLVYLRIDILPVTFLFLSVIFLKKFLESKNYAALIISNVIFLCSIFSKEVYLLVVPAILLFFMLFPENKLVSDSLNKRIRRGVLISLPYGVMAIMYLSVRLMLFGVDIEKKAFQFYQWKQYVWIFCESTKNLIGATFVATARPQYTLLLIFPLLIGIIYGILKSGYKKHLVFFFVLFFLVGFPVYCISYNNRYLYVMIPFVVFILFFLIKGHGKEQRNIQCATIALLCFAGWGVVDNVRGLKNENYLSYTLQQSFKLFDQEFLSHIKKDSHVICFGLPYDLLAVGLSKAVKLITGRSDIKISQWRGAEYFFDSLKDCSSCCLEVQPIKNGYRLKSLNDKIWWFRGVNELEGTKKRGFWGITTIKKKNDKRCVSELDITLLPERRKLLGENLLFFYWDPGQKKFMKLPSIISDA